VLVIAVSFHAGVKTRFVILIVGCRQGLYSSRWAHGTTEGDDNDMSPHQHQYADREHGGFVGHRGEYAPRQERLDQFREMGGLRVPVNTAARRLSVSYRTVERYRAILKLEQA
jgi:hypothetical protein